MAQLRQNTWRLGEWYDQSVAGAANYIDAADLYTWGSNSYGRLGHNSETDRSSPTQVPGNWSSAGVGYGIKMSGDAYIWGRGSQGRLGLNNTTSRSSPTQIPGNWKVISKKQANCGAIRTDGTLWTWGSNNHGQLGHGNKTLLSSPKQVGSASTWKYLNTGGNWFNGIKTDGTLWSWGQNTQGQLGHNDRSERLTPTQIPGTNWKSVQSNQYGNIAVKTNGTAWAWGINEAGQLMQNNRTRYSSPTQVPGTDWDTTINDISNAAGNPIGGTSVLMLRKTNGNIFYAGGDGMGVAALNCKDSASYRSSPVELGAGTAWAGFCEDKNFKAGVIFGNSKTMLAVTPGGQLWAWGGNNHGSLGQNQAPGNVGAVSSPIQIPGTDWATTKFPGGGWEEAVCWFK